MLDIIKLLHGARLCLLDNAHCHVRLQSHQPARSVGKGDDALTLEKISVFPIQIIGFKIAHAVAAIAALFKQAAQQQRQLFISGHPPNLDLQSGSSCCIKHPCPKNSIRGADALVK